MSRTAHDFSHPYLSQPMYACVESVQYVHTDQQLAMEIDSLSFDFQRRLRWITLAVIAITGIAQLLLLPALTHLLRPVDVGISEGLLLFFGVWTWAVKYEQLSTGRRIAGMLFEIVLVGCACYMGAWKIFHFLLMCLVAKSALQVNLKPLIGLMAVIFFTHVICNAAKAAVYYQWVAHNSGGILPQRSPGVVTFETHMYFIFAMIVVAAMMRTMIAERQSRVRAEQLADDVENLIIKNERSRISRDIHDSLGHTLTALNIQLEVAKTMLDKDPEVAKEALNTAKDLASESLSEVRRSVHMIREQEGIPFNLRDAVTTLATRAQNSHDVEIDLSIDTPELPLFKAHNVFCIVQEALTNAQRHAHAKSIRIIFDNKLDQLKVHIADDGIGFAQTSDFPGLGLRSMNERAQGVGGTLQIDSAPGDGTKVCLTMPL
jgi:signal transduction histidine kinase